MDLFGVPFEFEGYHPSWSGGHDGRSDRRGIHSMETAPFLLFLQSWKLAHTRVS